MHKHTQLIPIKTETKGLESPKKRNIGIYLCLPRIRKNLQSSLTVFVSFFFFPAENKATKRRQAIYNDLGLILSNRIYI